MLNTIEHGARTERPDLLIAHGLFGSGRNWGAIAKRVSDSRRVMAVDMRNHGTSPRFDTNSYPDMAGDLAQVLEGSVDAPSDVLGHSMGGKSAMVLALTRPELVRRLIIADIAPIGYSHTQSHLIDAMERLDLSGVSKRSEAAERLDVDENVKAFLLQSADLKAGEWRFNLPVLRAEMDKIIGFPKMQGSFEGPTLFLTGGASDYVLPEHRDEIKRLFPRARFAKLPDVGHWLHAEKPREFDATVRAFLDA
ncbi:alpha/beta fold hydrolase [Thalassobium sp. R2A62]|jgi:pimeloyl-ACP methyl ester carboxylesterase|uniref:alpha/beta fold hydrolase n=1 Tax=Thalassobium sp. R2A62 TaxID=633131 RepID=UPI0001B1CABC|nr:alpha/beta fold hydrolase [Thalassobium sp. R2A62]EET47588.1 esterase YbfF [Thalassobium sp. R2A62]